MTQNEIKELFNNVADGKIVPDEAVLKLKIEPFHNTF